MCIRTDFKKWSELEKKCHRNKTKIGILNDQIKILEKESNKNPFDFLQNTNNVDLYNKEQKQLICDNIDIEDEIRRIPKHIKKELCESITDYFTNKHNKLKLEADLAIEKVHEDIKRKNVMKRINITGSSLLLLMSFYFIKKKVQ